MDSPAPHVQLRTLDDLDRLLEDATPVLVFKHSTACPVSARAHAEFAKWLAAPGPHPRTALVRVIEERPVSLEIARRLDVAHQSPQAILVVAGRAVWHASHGWVNAGSLAANAKAGPGG